MSEYFEAFLLGNAAILGNVCVLPLYPGLLAFLAGQDEGKPRRGVEWLGLLVLAGVLSLMLMVGIVLFIFQQAISTILPILLPLTYGLVFILGILLLFGYNPFSRLVSSELPFLRNRYATAYCYGLLLGPMTLPCTGPLIISAFVLGAGDAVALADGIAYFLAFGLGFGWPLVALSFVAASTGQQITRWFARRSQIIHRLSGILLIGIALLGLQVDILPNVRLPGSSTNSSPDKPSVAAARAAALAPQPTALLPIDTATPAPISPAAAPQPTLVVAPEAPELRGITGWINSEALTLAGLRGKVVLIHFWTFACYNCANTLPSVTAWDSHYREQGLVIIGVHAPEFGYERERANVVEAAERFGISYPIAQDNDFATWKAYDNHYWPALYLIDAQGRIRYSHIGEGAYEETEQQIKQLLLERN